MTHTSASPAPTRANERKYRRKRICVVKGGNYWRGPRSPAWRANAPLLIAIRTSADEGETKVDRHTFAAKDSRDTVGVELRKIPK
jgi:hypothetical protein